MDKLKQAIFSMLEAEALKRGFEGDEDHFAAALAWPRVLDLYAGSGALGIEALSRGAQGATFVDRDRIATDTIQRNLEKTGLESGAEVRRVAVEMSLSTLTGPYDLILLDPPYQEGLGTLRTLERINFRNLLAAGGVIVWEHARSTVAPALPDGLRCVRRRDHGSTSVSLLENESSALVGRA
jgi:16S rRNA (guanine966-N2)-methyltransferase